MPELGAGLSVLLSVLWVVFVAGMIILFVLLFIHFIWKGECMRYPLHPSKQKALSVIEAELLKPDMWIFGFNTLEHKSKPIYINLFTYEDIGTSIKLSRKLVDDCVSKLRKINQDRLAEEILK